MTEPHVIGDSITWSRLTDEGHAKYVSTLRHLTATGKITLFEHSITWGMTDAYWVAHADPYQDAPDGHSSRESVDR